MPNDSSPKEKMDLVYATLPPGCKQEIEGLGGRIEDASDEVHRERVAVFYPENKTSEYESILEKFGLLRSSISAY